jgi:PIN domain nuclease of toxin-antitoxin system
MTAPLLDTHAWIWWMQADPRLGQPVVAALDGLGPDERPSISAISLWEVAMLVNLGRLDLGESLRSWLDAAGDPRTVRLLPITPAIANEVARIPDDVHRDPADRLIIASARVHDLPVLTRDQAIRRSKLVKLWSQRAA